MDNTTHDEDVKWLALLILRGLEVICAGIRKRYNIARDLR